jgi:hypothetical protein
VVTTCGALAAASLCLFRQGLFLFSFVFSAMCIIFCEYDLALKETMNNAKHLKVNKVYNETLEKPCIFNLQTVSMSRCHCPTS